VRAFLGQGLQATKPTISDSDLPCHQILAEMVLIVQNIPELTSLDINFEDCEFGLDLAFNFCIEPFT
jgi:hypothetical protein